MTSGGEEAEVKSHHDHVRTNNTGKTTDEVRTNGKGSIDNDNKTKDKSNQPPVEASSTTKTIAPTTGSVSETAEGSETDQSKLQSNMTTTTKANSPDDDGNKNERREAAASSSKIDDKGDNNVSVDQSKLPLVPAIVNNTAGASAKTTSSSVPSSSVVAPSTKTFAIDNSITSSEQPVVAKRTVSFSSNVATHMGQQISGGQSSIDNNRAGTNNPPPPSLLKEPFSENHHMTRSVQQNQSSPTMQSINATNSQLRSTMSAQHELPPSIDDKVQRLRAPLVDAYHPYIQPPDTSLEAARERLRTALDQTRQLRTAFSNRVYQKYRVVLKPVPASVDVIIDKIKSDPKSVSLKLQEEIRAHKQEKDIERKEQSKIQAALAASSAAAGDGGTASATVESAEQLAYISAGLSLVILPEDDIDDHGIDISKFPHRGPINPETGSRVGGISAAAATAAEVLLDRVRRSTAMRMERQRRRQLQLLSGEVDVESEADNSHVFSHLHLLSSSGIGRTDLVQGSASGATKRSGSGQRGSSAFASSQHAAAKASRARAGAAMSGSSLLSLNPSAEELSSAGRPSTAASAALISRGVGVATGSKSIQQRWRHPYPISLGARRAALTTTSSLNKKGEMALLTAAGLPPSAVSLSGHLAMSLPPLPTPSERKNAKPVKVLDNKIASTKRARDAIELVMEQFYSGEEETPNPSTTEATINGEEESLKKADEIETEAAIVNTESDAKAKAETDTGEEVIDPEDAKFPRKESTGDDVVSTRQSRRKKRHITEIGLLRGMHFVKEDDSTTKDEVAEDLQPSNESSIDPNLAFSVLHALGLVHEAPKEPPSQDEMFMSRLYHGRQESVLPESNSAPSAEINDAVFSKPENAIRQIITKKPLFSQIFSKPIPPDVKSSSKSELHEIRKKTEEATEAEATMDVDDSDEKPKDGVEEVSSMDVDNAATTSPVELANKDKLDSLPAKAAESQTQKDHTETKTLEDNQECIVESIRGGGEVLSSDDEEKESGSAPKPQGKSTENCEDPSSSKSKDAAPSSPERGPDEANPEQNLSQAGSAGATMMVGSPPVEMTSAMQPPHATWNERMALLNARQHNFSPPRNNTSRRQGQQHTGPVPHMAHAMPNPHDRYHHHQLQQQLAHRDLSDYFGGMHHPSQAGGFVPTQQEWSSLNAAAAGLLPASSSLAALGLSSHRAALVQMSVRERAARALLAREQAHVAAAHRQQQLVAAAAARGGAVALSSQQAVLMQSGHGGANFYQQGARYAHLGPHSATPMMTSSAAGSALIMNAQPPPPSTSPNPRPQDSRSKHSTSSSQSPGRNRSRSSSVDDKEKKKTSATQDVDSTTQISQSEAESSISPLIEGVPASADPHSCMPTLAMNTLSAHASKVRPSEENRGKDGKKDFGPRTTSQIEKATRGDIADDGSSDVVMQQADLVATKPPVGGTSSSPNNAAAPGSTTMPLSIPEDMAAANAAGTSGMRFLVPSHPPSLNTELAQLVVEGNIHLAAEKLREKPNRKQQEGATLLIEYLHSVGTAVPIPKALVSNPLKERLNTPGFKSPNGGSSTVPREVVVSVISVWLWVQHKECFQRAFAKSGRFDVDPECKWLIQAAVDSSARGLMLEIADAIARGAPLAIALSGNRNKASGTDGDRHPGSSSKLDIQIATIVSKALMTELCINDEMDVTLPHFEKLVNHLDSCRMSALRAKCRERALLAALISRRATMSEPFSHAYVSSMVRAGEALGHNELCEVVQDEPVMASTMIPYDFFSDESGAWEDPCRAPTGFTPNLTGEELTRRAHARAMIQKSLKKLQDKHNIKGGTQNAGPYADPTPSTEESGGSPNTESGTGRPGRPAIHRSNSGLRRRGSSFNMSDTSVSAGTGSGTATSMSLYNPNHYSSPLIWDTDDPENMPYGRFSTGIKKRSLSQSRLSFSGNKRQRVSRTNSAPIPAASSKKGGSKVESKVAGMRRGTEEIEWTDVAGIFQDVSLAGPTTPTARRAASSHGHHSTPVPAGTTIVAPFCRKIEGPLPEETNEEEEYSSEEEDLSDAAVLARHNLVLERMKTRLEKFMEMRQKAQQRARKKAKKPS